MLKPRVIMLTDEKTACRELQRLGCDPQGVAIMAAKAIFKTIKVEGVPAKAANLLKQTFLAKGGEVAVARGTADLSIEQTDVLICATLKQYRLALAQLKSQPWGLPALAKHVETTLANELKIHGRVYRWQDRSLTLEPGSTQLIGVVTLDLDSLPSEHAIMKDACRLINLGANIIEVKVISAHSSNFNMTLTSENLFSLLRELIINMVIPVAINTSLPDVAKAALAAGVHIASCAWGQKLDIQTAELAAAAGAAVVVSHSRASASGEAARLTDILHCWEESIEIGLKAGIAFDRFIADPGFDFDKTETEITEILSRLGELRSFGCPILLDTAGLNAAAVVWAISQGAAILRANDVKVVSGLAKATDMLMCHKDQMLISEGDR